ncbi:MAG: rhodanese domain-containing protein [Benjaminiella poitrasii]|nr:MAG: rhodanese domain-containing protein [Benjaminiella poitrasii]
MSSTIYTFSVNDLADWLNHKPESASFIDVREPNELIEQGVIKGYDANIPYFLTNANPELFESRSGRRSQLAAEYITSKLGFKNVYNVEGGILNWISHGFSVEKA